MTDKNFWKAMKSFLKNKHCLENSDIMLRDDAQKMITDEYPSIAEIHKNGNLQSSSISIASSGWGSRITLTEINTILKSLYSKKGPETDEIQTKLAKLASDILVEPLSIANNSSISTFSNNA